MSDKKNFIWNSFKAEASVNTLIFFTNKAGTFNPSITMSDVSEATWHIDGQESQTTNTPAFTLSGGVITVTVNIPDITKFIGFTALSQGIVGALNWGNAVSLDTLDVSGNAGLNSLSLDITAISGADVNINNTGVIDYTNIGLTRSLSADNSNLTSVGNLISGDTPGSLSFANVLELNSMLFP